MTIFICGDSTAASYTPDRAPLTGWGQALADMLPDIPVVNAAMAGRSTKSFLSEGRLIPVEEQLQPGDLMLIQFTHNDWSDLTWRHTDPWTSFMNNLAIFVETARLAGATPVLLTPICPHSTRSSSYVLSPEHVLTVEAPDANRKFVYLSVDGGKAFSLKNNDQVRVSTSKYTTRLVRLSKKSFCEILDKKMGGEVTKA